MQYQSAIMKVQTCQKDCVEWKTARRTVKFDQMRGKEPIQQQ